MVSQLDDQPPSGPRARASPGLGGRRTPRHHHGVGERCELLLAATLLPGTAAWQPSRTASSAASNGLLRCTESSLWVGCVVVARGGRVVGAAPVSSTGRPGGAGRAPPRWCRRIAAIGAVHAPRTCQHTNAVGGWTAPRTSGPQVLRAHEAAVPAPSCRPHAQACRPCGRRKKVGGRLSA